MIMPSMNHESHFGIGPRDLIHSLSQVLAGFRGGNPAVIGILQQKLETLGLAQGSPQKLLELSSPDEEREEWLTRTASTPTNFPRFSARGPQSPTFPKNMSMDGNYREGRTLNP